MRHNAVRSSEGANLFRDWPGLDLLYEAWVDARKKKSERWGFAVVAEELIEAGVGRVVLRELLVQGLAEHAEEQTRPKSAQRSFRPLRSLAIPKRACFVLTEAGAALAEEARKLRPQARQTREERASRNGKPPARPRWDGECVLNLDGEILKQFRRIAPMQKHILDEFERQGWPHRIDNPLPRQAGMNRKQHLRETIKNLNRGLTRMRIAFHADGTGQGIFWMRAPR